MVELILEVNETDGVLLLAGGQFARVFRCNIPNFAFPALSSSRLLCEKLSEIAINTKADLRLIASPNQTAGEKLTSGYLSILNTEIITMRLLPLEVRVILLSDNLDIANPFRFKCDLLGEELSSLHSLLDFSEAPERQLTAIDTRVTTGKLDDRTYAEILSQYIQRQAEQAKSSCKRIAILVEQGAGLMGSKAGLNSWMICR